MMIPQISSTPAGSPRRRKRVARHPALFSTVLFRLRPRAELLEDRTVLSTFLVDTVADSGPGSLRQAILDSNAAIGAANTIDFAIPGPGVQVIQPLSPLPAITEPVLIDGFSQPGYGGTPLIELSGTQAGTADGLMITSSDVTVRGLDINGFASGAGIHITGSAATGNWIYGDLLGTDPTGTQAVANDEGVEIDSGASDNLIGTNGDGVNDAAERNLLSGDLLAGVWITGHGTNGNVVAGNFIGTDASGTVALDNGTQPFTDSLGYAYGGGVWIEDGACDNRIGTDGESVDDAGQRNVIAGSDNDGIDVTGSGTDGNIVAGNFIGTDLTGSHPLGIAGDGVWIAQGASFNWIGVNPYGGTALADERNVISGAGYGGVEITGSGTIGNVVDGNYIGTDASGTTDHDNAGDSLGNHDGVEIDSGATDNTVGGTNGFCPQRHLGQRLCRTRDLGQRHERQRGGGELLRHRRHRHRGSRQPRQFSGRLRRSGDRQRCDG